MALGKVISSFREQVLIYVLINKSKQQSLIVSCEVPFHLQPVAQELNEANNWKVETQAKVFVSSVFFALIHRQISLILVLSSIV